MRTENQDKKSNQITQSKTFNVSKNKNKPKELLNANENCPFEPTSTREISKS
jgi:hypothetical protein